MRLMGQIIPLGSTLKVQKSSLNAGTYDTRRPREHLTPEEAERLIRTTRKLGRQGERDSTMIRVAYEHGLRGTEVRLLLWSQLDIASRNPSIGINRLKGSASDSHPLYPEELKALRRLYKIAPLDSPYVFTAETGGPLSLQGFWAIVKRAGESAGFAFPILPTCCATAPATGSGHRAGTSAISRSSSGTGTSRIRCATRKAAPSGSGGSVGRETLERSGRSAAQIRYFGPTFCSSPL
jgi:integrase